MLTTHTTFKGRLTFDENGFYEHNMIIIMYAAYMKAFKKYFDNDLNAKDYFDIDKLNIKVIDNSTGRIEKISKEHLFEWLIIDKNDTDVYKSQFEYKRSIKELFGDNTKIQEMITLVFTATGFIPPDYSDDIGEENVVDLYINFGFYKDSFGRIYHEIVYETDGLRDFTLVNMDLQVDCCINTHFYIKAERLIKPSVYLN